MGEIIVQFCRDCSRPFDVVKRNRVPELCTECKREAQRVYFQTWKEKRRALLG